MTNTDDQINLNVVSQSLNLLNTNTSKQNMDFEMANEQYIVSFSQHDDPIEIRHRAMAPCKESHTLALLQIPHDILIEKIIEDTVSGQELQLGTVLTIVTV